MASGRCVRGLLQLRHPHHTGVQVRPVPRVGDGGPPDADARRSAGGLRLRRGPTTLPGLRRATPRPLSRPWARQGGGRRRPGERFGSPHLLLQRSRPLRAKASRRRSRVLLHHRLLRGGHEQQLVRALLLLQPHVALHGLLFEEDLQDVGLALDRHLLVGALAHGRPSGLRGVECQRPVEALLPEGPSIIVGEPAHIELRPPVAFDADDVDRQRAGVPGANVGDKALRIQAPR
mmetsp:Transcript_18110/g.51625  ORF Transcript_18110/g.51625 Transcript_18110/m.51625 type:complete len:233 (-) Transcript_18110:1238-1936(-)